MVLDLNIDGIQVMNKNNFKDKIIKIRIQTELLDNIVFFLLFLIISNFIVKVGIHPIFTFFTFYFVYFGLFIKITNGYTIGNFLTKSKIVSLDGKKISLYSLQKKKYYESSFFIKNFYSGEQIINGYGQFDFDIELDLTVLPNNEELNNLNKEEIYKYNFYMDISHLFIRYILFIFGSLFVFIYFIDSFKTKLLGDLAVDMFFLFLLGVWFISDSIIPKWMKTAYIVLFFLLILKIVLRG